MVEIKEKATKPSVARKIGDKILGFDNFSHPVNMTFEGGKQSLATWAGTILSLLLVAIVVSYSVQKVRTLINKTDPDISISVSEKHFSDKEVFHASQGLSIAVSLIDYDSNKE